MLGGCDLPDCRISMQSTQVLVALSSGEHISDLGVHILPFVKKKQDKIVMNEIGRTGIKEFAALRMKSPQLTVPYVYDF
jgi:hypothetical protein